MAKNVTTDQTRLSFITTARGNADAALPRGRRSVRRAIRLVHEKVSTCRIGRTGASRFGTEERIGKGWDSTSLAGLSGVSMRVCRFRGLRLTPCFRACTGAWGPDLAH